MISLYAIMQNKPAPLTDISAVTAGSARLCCTSCSHHYWLALCLSHLSFITIAFCLSSLVCIDLCGAEL